MRIALTSSLPIDLGAAIPGAIVGEPAPIAALDLRAADALVCTLRDRVDAAVLARAPRLRVVANCAVGIDNVDVAAATAAGVCVTNTPDVLTEATAELAIALMFAAARRLGEGERLVRSGAWTGWALDQLLGVPLAGKTLGIVGFGRIGQAVARRAAALGMAVVYHTPHRDPAVVRGPAEPDLAASAPRERADPEQRARLELDDLFARADVVSLHCPLTAETRHLVDARRLALLKPTAIVINTARGACIDDGALADALTAGRLFAAGLDVFSGEPAIDPRLLAAPRVVLAPHLGSATTETRMQMAQRCADGVAAVLAGRRPPNLVNGEVWDRRREPARGQA